MTFFFAFVFKQNGKCICLHLFAFYFFYRIVCRCLFFLSIAALFFFCSFFLSFSLSLSFNSSSSLSLIVCNRFCSPDEPENCVIPLVLYILNLTIFIIFLCVASFYFFSSSSLHLSFYSRSPFHSVILLLVLRLRCLFLSIPT